ncbi:exgA [Candida metapsilosis]|uniref:Glucan 1,3-beta-glucosidase n=1 Tax=Candida metapsilosis TaxID=273372 RepID=A0A8H7ZH83_9ASCO|nr:exgA [Candida metapsilosis]
MRSFIVFTIFASCIYALAITPQKRGESVSWNYAKETTRGLNLGGWFVLEAYITPSLFGSWLFGDDENNIPVDEYHFTKQLGKEAAEQVLQMHWNSWYTEDDFEQMSYLGINTVRIPIGYWAFQLLDDDPYVQGQVEYLDKALQWARNHNLKVWIDLHGAPGSQNGFDNSGLRDTIDWQKVDGNVQVTKDVLNTIFQKYGTDDYADVVIGIELINEPLGPSLNVDELKQFYQDGYSSLRSTGSNTPVIIHDAFESIGYWDGFSIGNNAFNVVLDHHHYQVFSAKELERSIDEHISVACNWGWDTKKESYWTVTGEWSAALTDCAKWLNGVRRGARYEGQYDNSPYIGSCQQYLEYSTWPDDYKTNVRKYIEAQLDAYEYTGGWIFWNWKTEDAIEWDFQRLTAAGIFPQPLTDRQYPNQCGFPSN